MATTDAWTDITDEKSLEAFLKDKPPAWHDVIGARAALRVWPALNISFDVRFELDRPATTIILPLLRRMLAGLFVSLASDSVAAAVSAAESASDYAHSAAVSRYAFRAAVDSAKLSHGTVSVDYSARSAAASALAFSATSGVSAGSAAYVTVNADALYLATHRDEGKLSEQPLGAINIDWAELAMRGADSAKLPPIDLFAPQWESLKRNLLALDEHWQVWLDWYEAIRDGHAPWGVSRKGGLDLLLEALQWPEADWSQGPKHINPKLTALVEMARERERAFVPAPEMPLLEVGPTFVVSNGRLTLQHNPRATEAINPALQMSLHARLQRLLPVLAEASSKAGNTHPGLSFIVQEYAELVAPNYADLDDAAIWAVGAGLIANAGAFARHEQLNSVNPGLEPDHFALLKQAADIHSAFVLGQPIGRAMVDRADEMRLTDDQFALIGDGMMAVLDDLSSNTDVVVEATRRFVGSVRTAMLVGGWHAGRTGFAGYVVTRNSLLAIAKVLVALDRRLGTVIGGLALAALDPQLAQTQHLIQFFHQNSQQILLFTGPFPELRTWFSWLLEHLHRDRDHGR